jgi:hypothetical protein
MASQMESGSAGGAASDSATSQSEAAAMENVSVVKGGPAQQGGTVAHGSPVGAPGPYPSYHGRRISWIAVTIMMVGFLVGGLAMVFGSGGPIWWLFWVGAGVTVLGLLVSLATNTFEDWY